MINEIELEKVTLSWFQDNGYHYLNGKDIAPESENPMRISFKEVVLEKELLQSLQKLNPDIPISKLEEVVKVLKNPEAGSSIQQNKIFHYQLLRGIDVDVERNGVKEKDLVHLIDFQHPERNSFSVVNQFSISGSKFTRRPDILVFINGLPIAILELKNPSNEDTDLWDAYNQLQTYKEDIPDLFIYNEALVVSDGITARIGSLTAKKERFLPWRTIENEDDRPLLEYQLEAVIKGFFKPVLFLDYLRHFVLYEQDGDSLIKKIAAYHQFHAVRNAVQATIVAANLEEKYQWAEPRADYSKRVQRGSKKAGVVWHTQGSGKSISMVCYAGKLMQQPEMQNPTIVVVTDRSDLDGQLFKTFSQSEELLRETPIQAESREDLREILATRKSGGIVFTTIQKFGLRDGENKHPQLSNRTNVVVISDEAHRSQYGDKAKLDTKTGQYKYGYAKHLRDALPEATFIGFTGTPISQGDKDTRAVFGDEVSIYDIQDAVDDGATVPIYYESRLAKLDINRAKIDKLSDEVEEIIEDEEDLVLREGTKSKWAALEKLVGAEPRLKEVAEDLIAHFEGKTKLLPGKAIIVCMSREICVNLYNEITALRPEWHNEDPAKGFIKIVMTGSAADKELLRPHIYTSRTRKDLEKRFKDLDDELKLVIVRDMWLTGFDAPACHTMYIDKPMRGHNLMQAIARVNRVFKDKPGGLVVDYIGIANELKEALRTYTESKGKGSPTLKTQEAYHILLKNLDAVRGMMYGFNYSTYKTEPLKLLIPAANHILEERERGKRRFLDLMAAVNKAYSLCSTLEEAQELKLEIAFFNAIKTAFIKSMNVDQKRLNEEKNSLLKRILDNAIIPEGVDDVFQLVGLEKPNIGVLSEEFLREVRQMPHKNLAVELLERLLKDEIKARTKGNVVQEKKYGDRLIDTLRRYNNRAIETAQVIELLIEMHKDFVEAIKREQDLGLSQDEIRFYFALAEHNTGENALQDENLKKVAIELTARLRESTTVDWQVRESVKAKIRNMVRRLLRRYGYPPDFSQDAVDLILKQATALADMWTVDERRSQITLY
ncbi:type I restriction endonuclease subunit R [Pontibacter oryzae]|uniref:Type I restriction enzyme endonuclease subunit n=1 Tax=Pontibacter oryzae TaxID=2304593 RepID=A0A399SEW6_9BACT|nr:type I restriction endonuclease subunit R [Pontibacter oryzae]RIJ42656.1 type I restriction endonuclease subunit R [Pontibacter oryzae]